MQAFSWWRRARGSEWALLAALLACYFISAILPASLAHEGGVLENLQVAVLGAGCALSLLVFLRTRPARIAMLALWVAPIWLLLAGRELSWGKAWLPSPGVDAAGAAMAVTPLWFGSLVWPAAGLLLSWLVLSAWHYRIDELARAALSRRTPWIYFGVMLGAAIGSTCAEGHMSCRIDMPASQAQVFEELAELVGYIALCLVQNVVFVRQARSCVALAHGVDAAPEKVG
jgi:hypothetical protein